MKLSFFVPGIPVPGGSKRAFPFKRGDGSMGVRVTDAAGERNKNWRAVVAHEAGVAMQDRPLFSGPIILAVCFSLPRPKAHYRGRSDELRVDAPIWHTKKPDATKLLRALEDALTGIVWTDDCIIAEQYVRKVYPFRHSGRTGATVTVSALGNVAAFVLDDLSDYEPAGIPTKTAAA